MVELTKKLSNLKRKYPNKFTSTVSHQLVKIPHETSLLETDVINFSTTLKGSVLRTCPMLRAYNGDSMDSELVEIPLLFKTGQFSRATISRQTLSEAFEILENFIIEIEKSIKSFQKIRFIFGFLIRGMKLIFFLLTLLALGLVLFGAFTDDKILMYVPLMIYVVLGFLACFLNFRYRAKSELILKDIKQEVDQILLSYHQDFTSHNNIVEIFSKCTSKSFAIILKVVRVNASPTNLSTFPMVGRISATNSRYRASGQVSPYIGEVKPHEIPIHEINILSNTHKKEIEPNFEIVENLKFSGGHNNVSDSGVITKTLKNQRSSIKSDIGDKEENDKGNQQRKKANGNKVRASGQDEESLSIKSSKTWMQGKIGPQETKL